MTEQVEKETKADLVGGIGTTMGKAAKVATACAMHGTEELLEVRRTGLLRACGDTGSNALPGARHTAVTRLC